MNLIGPGLLGLAGRASAEPRPAGRPAPAAGRRGGRRRLRLRLVRAAVARADLHSHGELDRRQRLGLRGRCSIPGRRDVPAAAAPGRVRARRRRGRPGAAPVHVRLDDRVDGCGSLQHARARPGHARHGADIRRRTGDGDARCGRSAAGGRLCGGRPGHGHCQPGALRRRPRRRTAGQEGRSTSSIPLARQVGSGVGAAVAGIVFAATLSAAQVSAAQHRERTCPRSSTPLA